MNKTKLLQTLTTMIENLGIAINEIQTELDLADQNNPWRTHALLLELKTMLETHDRWKRLKRLLEEG